MKTKANYIALSRDLEKYKELLIADHDLDCLNMVKDKIFTRELIEDYGWVIPDRVIANERWFEINSRIHAGTFGGKSKAIINWEDNGRKPINEFLLVISFPEGAYSFGSVFSLKIFNQFFRELETFEPKYKDSRNHSLYFTKEKAGKLLQEYKDVTRKYLELYSNDRKVEEIKELKAKLKKLEGNAEAEE